MTANVRIPVASAANVTAVPLEAVFTEKNPDTDQMERFVYVQRGDAYEKRNVKVGIADYFYAEIQDGLSPGDVVALEMPKEELEKQTHPLANQRGNSETGSGATKLATPAPSIRTNSAPATPSPAKAIPAATQTGGRTAAGSS
jgi:hypothetical protein